MMGSPDSHLPPKAADVSMADESAAMPSDLVPSGPEPNNAFGPHTTSIIQDDDSASDVSMSADTDDEEDEDTSIHVNSAPKVSAGQNTMATSPKASDGNKKRKHSDSVEGHSNSQVDDVRKRFKPDEVFRDQDCHLPQDRSVLPAEIWHCIFNYTPPRSLGALLHVNKLFNAYLDPSSDKDFPTLSNSAVRYLKPDAIWQASRRLFRPQMPHPLAGKYELDMWRLACCTSCQFCGKKTPSNPLPQPDQWHPGPGENGITTIWPFAVRTCGPCLEQRTMKEIDLLLSSSIPSPLMAALPLVFLANELHVIPSATLQNGQPPSSIQVGKRFYKPHVEAIKGEFLEAKGMSSATAEEWLNGLDDRGKERRNDAARWERWEHNGGVARMCCPEPRESQHMPLPANIMTTASNEPVPAYQGLNPTSSAKDLPNSLPQIPPPIQTSFPTQPPQRFDSPALNGFGAYQPRMYPQTRHERTKEEAAELKASRRAEIERRSMLLNPPLTAGVLAHMCSFQAAIQIIQPLDDNAWEVLKPRLLAQRQEAEQRENERIAQSRVVQDRLDERRFQDVYARSESKDNLDREWDDLQAPIRARIGGYADEIIHNSWNNGGKVTKETCSRFAADVLVYVRKRFYAEMAKDEAAIRAAGRQPENDPSDGPYTRKLVLENMKWVFDTKIKPHTEQYSKELFLCSACENNFKYYGFEGVIQHYAAKHTTSLSVGTVVVHWKAEWPEFPPFNPDPPGGGQPSYYTSGPSVSAPYPMTPQPVQQSHGYGNYQSPVSGPVHVSNPHAYQENPALYYGHSQYGEQYPPQNGPYPPPQAYHEAPQEYQPYSGQQYPAAQPPIPTNGYSDPSQNYPQPGYGTPYHASTQAAYPAPIPDHSTQHVPYTPQSAQYAPSYTQAPAYPTPNHQFAQGVPHSEEYVAQLQDLARNAREIWNSLTSVKEVPGSVKVFTIIYHILKRSKASFQEDRPLSMLIDGLSNNKNMRPVRNINGLLCRACTLGMPGTPLRPEKKHFSFPQLVNHFHSVHEQGVTQKNLGPVPDWTKDMVELPDQPRLNQIQHAPGMDDQRLKLFAEALPEIVAQPRVNDTPSESTNVYRDAPRHKSYAGLPPSQDNHGKYYTSVDNPRNGYHDDFDPRERRATMDASSMYATSQRPMHHQAINNQRDSMRTEPRPTSPRSQMRPLDGVGHYVLREEAPVYMDKETRYRDGSDGECRARRDPHLATYGEREIPQPRRESRMVNAQSYYSNMQESPAPAPPEGSSNHAQYRPAGENASENSLYDVVAKISQQAQQVQQARGKQLIKEEAVDVGSEDGELRAKALSTLSAARANRLSRANEASNAADRFLNDLIPSGNANKVGEVGRQSEDTLSQKLSERGDGMHRVYQSPEPQRRLREGYEVDDGMVGRSGRSIYHPEGTPRSGYVVQERAQQPVQARPYAYDERYMASPPEAIPRDRSPELVDHRYKVNNVVYRDERQANSRRTPSRYARYESVRVENDRARSRSPLYVKVGQQPGQFQERSPGGLPLQQEPIYRTRAAQPSAEEVAYERAPRQEYYRVYADEPRARQPQYAEAYEYVQMSDANGDYMIRRPVHREAEPVYATYEHDGYNRPQVYERRPAAQRSDAVLDDEEYDPRHPAPPPPPAAIRQVRYQ